MSTEENMKLWRSVEETNPAHQKRFKGAGFSGTAVDAMRQRERATEVFGPFGQGWGVEEETFHTVIAPGAPHTDTLLAYEGTMWFEDKQKHFPIHAACPLYRRFKNYEGGPEKYRFEPDPDAWKKAATDALTKGLSFLGFNADVHMGKYDDNRYVQAMEEKFAEKPTQADIDASLVRVKHWLDQFDKKERDIEAERAVYREARVAFNEAQDKTGWSRFNETIKDIMADRKRKENSDE